METPNVIAKLFTIKKPFWVFLLKNVGLNVYKKKIEIENKTI